MEFKRHKLNQRVLNDLERRSSIGLVLYLTVVIVLLYVNQNYLKYPTFASVFFFSILGVIGLRILQLVYFKKLSALNELLNIRVFYCNVLLTSLVWGLAFAWFLYLVQESESRLLMVICTVGLTSGGIVAFMPDRRLAITYNILMLLPAAVISYTFDISPVLSFLLVLYSGYMVSITIRGNKEYWNALENEVKLQDQSVALQEASTIDVLTGLYNRRHFNEVFEMEWKRASRENYLFTVVMGDIDHFKSVNDTYGHLAGDDCLRHVSAIFRDRFQRETDLVARYGGEEFVVLLPDTDAMRAFEMAEAVRSNVETSPVQYKDKFIPLTISFGIASIVPNHREPKNELLNRADEALYQAKEAGRNCVKMSNS